MCCSIMQIGLMLHMAIKYPIVHTTPNGIEAGKFGSNRVKQLKCSCSTCSACQELRQGGMFRHIWVTASMPCNTF